LITSARPSRPARATGAAAARDRAGAAVLEHGPGGEPAVGVGDERRERVGFGAGDRREAAEVPAHLEQRAVSQRLAEIVLESRGAPVHDLGAQATRIGIERRIARAVRGDQRRQLRVPARRQLGNQQREVRGRFGRGERAAGAHRGDRVAVDHEELVTMAQEVAEMQVVLDQPVRVQAAEHREGGREQRERGRVARRPLRVRRPLVREAFRVREVVGQQRVAVAGERAGVDQAWRRNVDGGERGEAVALALHVPRAPAGDEELREHAAAVELRLADDALSG